VEFDRWLHLPEREGVQTAAKLHYGKCGMQQFWDLPFAWKKKKKICILLPQLCLLKLFFFFYFIDSG